MPALVDAVYPYQPFPNPVAIPTGLPADGDTVCLKINRTWLPYLIACSFALLADSTWNSNDPATVRDVEQRAYSFIRQMNNPEVCPVPVAFRVNPVDNHFWDFSNDGGTTWTRQPDTVSTWTPQFTVNALSPSGYDETVNGGLSSAHIPLLTASDPTAVITDPSSDLRNLITALPNTVEALAARVDTQIVARLVDGGVSALFAKIADPSVTASDPVVKLTAGTDYTFNLLEVD